MGEADTPPTLRKCAAGIRIDGADEVAVDDAAGNAPSIVHPIHGGAACSAVCKPSG